MGVTASTSRRPGAGGPGRAPAGPARRIRRRMPGRARACLAAAAAGVMAAAAAVAAGAPAGATTSGAGLRGPQAAQAAQAAPSAYSLRLRAMPRGTVTFGRRAGRLTVHAVMTGLTPGSEHGVHLLLPGHAGAVRFSPLAASAAGRPAPPCRATSRARCLTGAAW